MDNYLNQVTKEIRTLQSLPQYSKGLEEGDIVKINFKKIKNSGDWESLSPKYQKWISSHRYKKFTVEWDEIRKNIDSIDKKNLVCLKEDKTKPKWLFYSDDLILCEKSLANKETSCYNDRKEIDIAIKKQTEEIKNKLKDL